MTLPMAVTALVTVRTPRWKATPRLRMRHDSAPLSVFLQTTLAVTFNRLPPEGCSFQLIHELARVPPMISKLWICGRVSERGSSLRRRGAGATRTVAPSPFRSRGGALERPDAGKAAPRTLPKTTHGGGAVVSLSQRGAASN